MSEEEEEEKEEEWQQYDPVCQFPVWEDEA